MGLASQEEIDKAVIDAKKNLCDEEIMDVLRGCTVGGPITSRSQCKRLLAQGGGSLDDWKGGDLKNGKTDS